MKTPRLCLEIEVKEQKEDGSYVYEITGSKQDIDTMHQSILLQAIIVGIEESEKRTDRWLLKQEAIDAAEELVKFLDLWEVTDELDYTPTVECIKNNLKAKLKALETVKLRD